VVGDQGEVVVVAFPAHLVDPDAHPPVEPAGVEPVGDHLRADPAHGVPLDPGETGGSVVLSVLVAPNATRSCRSWVNPVPTRAKGTASTGTPWVGQRGRRSPAHSCTCQRPKSRRRPIEDTGRVSN